MSNKFGKISLMTFKNYFELIFSIKIMVKYKSWLVVNIHNPIDNKNIFWMSVQGRRGSFEVVCKKICFDGQTEIVSWFWIILANYFQCLEPILSKKNCHASVMYAHQFTVQMQILSLMSKIVKRLISFIGKNPTKLESLSEA